MNRFIPGLVICGAIITVGTGIAAFSRSSGGVWDIMFLVSVVVFLAVFLSMLRAKAAATMFNENHSNRDQHPPL